MAFLLSTYEEGATRPSLIVAPTSVMDSWMQKIKDFAPSLRPYRFYGPERRPEILRLPGQRAIVTTYTVLARDIDLLSSMEWETVVLDEAQYIKTSSTQYAQAAKRLSARTRLALTGTPIENRLSEIWSIFDFVAPGLLGTLKNFEERYARPIDRGDQETSTKLRTIIHPLVMRRTKIEVAPELPAKIEQEIVVPLAEEQQKLYAQILREVKKSVMSEVEKQGIGKAQIQILAALTRLRQVACDPRLMKLEGAVWKPMKKAPKQVRQLISDR
jgi:SNF2 family DNA or RNA helicase